MILVDNRKPKSPLPRHFRLRKSATPHKGVKFFKEGFKTFENTNLYVKD